MERQTLLAAPARLLLGSVFLFYKTNSSLPWPPHASVFVLEHKNLEVLAEAHRTYISSGSGHPRKEHHIKLGVLEETLVQLTSYL